MIFLNLIVLKSISIVKYALKMIFFTIIKIITLIHVCLGIKFTSTASIILLPKQNNIIKYYTVLKNNTNLWDAIDVY